MREREREREEKGERGGGGEEVGWGGRKGDERARERVMYSISFLTEYVS